MKERPFPRPIVRGHSMDPLLLPGDLPVMEKVQRTGLVPGDVIVFQSSRGSRVIHRVIRVFPFLQTQGDNRTEPDSPVPADSPLFLVTAFERKGKRIPLPGGPAGRKQQLHFQRKRAFRRIFSRFCDFAARFNPFKIPFSRMKKIYFTDQCFCYFHNRPVGKILHGKWTWMMHGGRIFFSPPAEQDLRIFSSSNLSSGKENF